MKCDVEVHILKEGLIPSELIEDYLYISSLDSGHVSVLSNDVVGFSPHFVICQASRLLVVSMRVQT